MIRRFVGWRGREQELVDFLFFFKVLMQRAPRDDHAPLLRSRLLCCCFFTDVDSRCGMFHIKLMRAARWRGGNEVLAHMFISAPRLMCFFFPSSRLMMIGSGRTAASAQISLAVRLCRVYSALAPRGGSVFSGIIFERYKVNSGTS